MQVAIVTNGQVTAVGDYKTVFPNTSFPVSGPSDAILAELSAKKVTLFKAHDRATQKLVSCAPYVDGEFVCTVEVQSKTADEIAADTASLAAQKRAARDNALKASDWRAIRAAETGVPMASDWAAYRQALRDFPAQTGFPNIDLPHDPDYVPMP
jgi:hypothetical protein